MPIRHVAFAAALLCGTATFMPPAEAQMTAPTTTTTTTTAAAGADARHGDYFRTNGETIFYQESGQGPDLLLIHGFPLSGRLFSVQLAQLAADFHVIVVDLPGFGNSSTNTSAQTDASYADAMVALLAHLRVTHAIIGGHSMGGQITLQLYAQDPTLFDGMILFDTNPAAASIIEQNEWPGYARQAEQMGSASLAPGIKPVMVTGRALMQDPRFNTQLTHIVASASPDGVAGGANALVTRPDFDPLLSAISVPALVMVGQDDPLYATPVSEALASAIPGSKLAIIPEAGHASMYQRPDVADAAILTWANANGLLR